MGGNGHALKQTKGVAFHQHAIGKRTAVALIGVHTNIFVSRGILRLACMGSRWLIRHCAPLDPCGKARTAATAQAGIRHRLHHFTATHSEGVFKTGQATVGHVVFRVDRVGNSHPLVNPAILLGEVLDLFHRTNKIIRLLVGYTGVNLPRCDV